MAALAGLSILVPESRELDLFARMLEAEGATALRCPLVQILDLDDTKDVDAWIGAFIARPFDDLVLLTGEGLRRLLTLSGARRRAFIGALEKTRLVTRGPKPARALREIGLVPSLPAVEPTSDGVLQALAHENLKGRHIGVQLYPGNGGRPLVQALAARGAEVFPVTPYRYADEADRERVVEIIYAVAAGRIGLIAFTATPQIERLMAVAQDAGLGAELKQGLARTPIAAIGPVVGESLHRIGVAPTIQPKDNFHLKPLVRAIIAWRGSQESPA
ncbi:MAG TPA: uroporphyrinogen-III synthase [Rhizomicrobium sp.]|nr:uroporphyrinogen-III synthase [Rhizomicrobium sp.]